VCDGADGVDSGADLKRLGPGDRDNSAALAELLAGLVVHAARQSGRHPALDLGAVREVVEHGLVLPLAAAARSERRIPGNFPRPRRQRETVGGQGHQGVPVVD